MIIFDYFNVNLVLFALFNYTSVPNVCIVFFIHFARFLRVVDDSHSFIYRLTGRKLLLMGGYA